MEEVEGSSPSYSTTVRNEQAEMLAFFILIEILYWGRLVLHRYNLMLRQ